MQGACATGRATVGLGNRFHESAEGLDVGLDPLVPPLAARRKSTANAGGALEFSVRDPELQPASRAPGNRPFPGLPQLTLRQALRATRLKLWDERRGRLVSFREARA